MLEVLRSLGDADDRARDVPGAVEVRLVGGHGRRRVGELLRLVRDEGHAPLAIEVHGDLATLERVRRRPLVTGAGVELDEVLVPVPVHEALLPAQHLRPRRIGGEARVALGVDPLRAEERDERRDGVLVEADEGVEADDLQRAVGVPLRQLFRVGRQLGERSRRPRQAGVPEELLVVVEAADVREQRQRTALAFVLRVVARRRRELVHVEPRGLDRRPEVLPRAAPAVRADVVGRPRDDDVRHLARADRRRDLVVADVPDDLDLDAGSGLVVHRDDLLELVELACGPGRPDRELDRFRLRCRRRAVRALRGSGCECERTENDGCGRNTFHEASRGWGFTVSSSRAERALRELGNFTSASLGRFLSRGQAGLWVIFR